MKPSTASKILYFLPFVILAAALVWEFFAMLAYTDGRFVYSLDDPYIHLALAERLAAGHYGINLGEASAPASSVLWPFLLAPFAATPFFEYVPLILNVIIAFATLWLYQVIVRYIFAPSLGTEGEAAQEKVFGWGAALNPRGELLTLVLMILLIPATNLFSLPMTGMENSLQVLLAVVIAYGMLRLADRGEIHAWFLAAVVLAPLVRFECLSLSVPALGLLLWQGGRRGMVKASGTGAGAGAGGSGYAQDSGIIAVSGASAALPAARAGRIPAHVLAFAITAGALALSIGGFSFFIHSQGLGWLPSSVISKTGYLSGSEPMGLAGAVVTSPAPASPLESLVEGLLGNLGPYPGKILGLLWLWLFIHLTMRIVRSARAGALLDHLRPGHMPADLLLALLGVTTLGIHLFFGRIGWWGRYEVYVVALAVILLIYLTRARWKADGKLPIGGLMSLKLIGLLIGASYIYTFLWTPLASANIYEQQYQMHRFLQEYYRGPVAVNDLGWVAYRNPYYVLDLWGLASHKALEARLSGAPQAQWMDEMAREHNVRFAMLYHEWFPNHPPAWREVARLHLGQEMTSVGGEYVTFYALDAETEERVRGLLAEFAETLPEGVRLEVVEE